MNRQKIAVKGTSTIVIPPETPSHRLTSTLSASDLSTETSLDSGNGTTRTARVAGNEVQTVLTLVQLGIGAAAGLASNVFDCLLVSIGNVWLCR